MTKKTTYHKLIRDRIPAIIEADGHEATIHVADDREFEQKLLEKLAEEVDEFLRDGEIEELADVLEVIYALAAQDGVSQDGLERIRRRKVDQRGSFSKRLILEETREV